jgi:hypothetical protein
MPSPGEPIPRHWFNPIHDIVSFFGRSSTMSQFACRDSGLGRPQSGAPLLFSLMHPCNAASVSAPIGASLAPKNGENWITRSTTTNGGATSLSRRPILSFYAKKKVISRQPRRIHPRSNRIPPSCWGGRASRNPPCLGLRKGPSHNHPELPANIQHAFAIDDAAAATHYPPGFLCAPTLCDVALISSQHGPVHEKRPR